MSQIERHDEEIEIICVQKIAARGRDCLRSHRDGRHVTIKRCRNGEYLAAAIFCLWCHKLRGRVLGGR
jgi:hypothetical protein